MLANCAFFGMMLANFLSPGNKKKYQRPEFVILLSAIKSSNNVIFGSIETSSHIRSTADSHYSRRITGGINYPAAPNGGIAASLGQATGYQSVNYNRPEELGTKPLSAGGGLKERHRIEGYPGGFCNS